MDLFFSVTLAESEGKNKEEIVLVVLHVNAYLHKFLLLAFDLTVTSFEILFSK